MQIAENTVATIHYTLHLGDGEIFDRSTPDAPLTYLHGTGDIIPGLEDALEGLKKGDTKEIVLSPEEGYGERDEEGIQVLPRDSFDADELKAGDELWGEDEDGDEISVTVVKVDGDQVTVDFNHPLAGRTLHYRVEVVDVRAATAEEIEHGHVHDGDEHDDE